MLAGGVTGMGLARHGLARQATPAAGWSFTDDKGVTVELDAMPERLAIDLNAAAALWDFGVRPTAVFGWDANETGDFGDAGGNIDPMLLLRVIEHGLVSAGRFLRLSVRTGDQPGEQ